MFALKCGSGPARPPWRPVGAAFIGLAGVVEPFSPSSIGLCRWMQPYLSQTSKEFCYV